VDIVGPNSAAQLARVHRLYMFAHVVDTQFRGSACHPAYHQSASSNDVSLCALALLLAVEIVCWRLGFFPSSYTKCPAERPKEDSDACAAGPIPRCLSELRVSFVVLDN
jgi:hypothetical protein